MNKMDDVLLLNHLRKYFENTAKHKQPDIWAPIMRSQSCPRRVKEGFVLSRRRTSATPHVFGACRQKWEITTFTDTAGA